jgi:NAD(P)-dependent dehydrogenase (short-subunit alcohol dehydrogenase family)
MGAHSGLAMVVLVTGSSSGIGRAICDQLGTGGARVYGASRSACTRESWNYLNVDVTDDASVQTAVDKVMGREGRIDALVNCAGVSLAGPIEDTSIEEAKWQFETNFYGTVRLIRAVLPAMRKQASGKIIVIGSIGGLIGLPYLGYYSAAKFALDGLVEALRTEIAPFGIQACVLHPGAFRTAMDANEVFASNSNSLSAYYETFRKTCALRAAMDKPLPTAIARKVQKMLSSRSLPVRVIVGSPPEKLGVLGKTLLPSPTFEYFFRKAYGP